MTTLLIAYVVSLVLFAGMDVVWLMFMGPALYRPVLGDVLAPSVRIGPALTFYALYPIGLVVFAISPALKSGSLATACALGALYGVLTYATYDLTNFATLRNWTLQLTVIDMLYGGLMSAAVCVLTVLVTPQLVRLI